MTEQEGKRIEKEYRDLRKEFFERKDKELESLRQQAEEQPRKYQQERRALKFAIAGSDGEDVKIPYSIACMLLKDLDALNAIRLTIQKL
jgi:chemotaxis methyl-accepting protein methylase